MLSDQLKNTPLLSEDDLKVIFESAWQSSKWCAPRKTKKNPEGLMPVGRLMGLLESAVATHLSMSARKAVTLSRR